MSDAEDTLIRDLKWPILATLMLLAWTAAVSSFTSYSDYWASYTALALICAPIPLHLLILIKKKWQLRYVGYAIAHILFSFSVGIVCLMLITKDSL